MPENVQPPAGAYRLLSCFADPALPHILGDLMEEFRERAANSGTRTARRWYWREAIRNAAVLLRRQPALQVAGSAILFLVVIHAVMIFAASYAWREWVTSNSPIVNGLPVRPWLGYAGASWHMAFPQTQDAARELYVAIVAGFGFGVLFARLCTGRVQAFRIAVVGCWLAISAWFVIEAVFFVNIGTRWPGSTLLFVRRLVMDFGIRESMAAGSFWVGTYLGAWRRRIA